MLWHSYEPLRSFGKLSRVEGVMDLRGVSLNIAENSGASCVMYRMTYNEIYRLV